MAKDLQLPFNTDSRCGKLPAWAQHELSRLRVNEINNDMANCLNGDIRRTAKQVLGRNLTFSDDDLRLLATLAVAAIEHDLHLELPNDEIITGIEIARQARKEERAGLEEAAAQSR